MSANINPILDNRYLQEIYEGDQVILQIMFETFLEDSLSTWEEISVAIGNQDFEKVIALTHQVKPSFSLVGLTHFHPKLRDFEILSHSNPTKEILLAKYLFLDRQLKEAKIVIEAALMEMNQHKIV